MDIENIWEGLKVEKKLGHGSYGSVFKCCKEINGKKEYSAVKVISVPQEDITDESSYISIDGMSADESREYYKEIVKGLMSEIKILESLKDSPNIVHIYDYRVFQKPDGIGWQIFIQMELLTDFNTYSADKELKENDIIKLGLDLCDALLACEKKKIIHRDIKPENIFIDDYGNFKLGDFGVAKQLERTEASMSRKGTYNYMAPEVLMAKKYDSRADIYSLGIVMYKLLNNNRMPFIDPEKKLVKYAEREEAYERRMAGEKIPPLRDVSEGLNAIILRACEFKPEYRFGNISELKTAIEKVSKGRAIKTKAWLKRNKLKCIIAASVAVVLALTSVFAVYAYRHRSGDEQPVEIIEKIVEKIVDSEDETTTLLNEDTEETTESSSSDESATAIAESATSVNGQNNVTTANTGGKKQAETTTKQATTKQATTARTLSTKERCYNAYADVVNNSDEYYLYDIDKNGIYELLVRKNNDLEIYTFDRNLVKLYQQNDFYDKQSKISFLLVQNNNDSDFLCRRTYISRDYDFNRKITLTNNSLSFSEEQYFLNWNSIEIYLKNGDDFNNNLYMLKEVILNNSTINTCIYNN